MCVCSLNKPKISVSIGHGEELKQKVIFETVQNLGVFLDSGSKEEEVGGRI